ncbi:hypothetical protein DFQ27_001086 [Actinomortierella ambigua]|uniref:Methyltransferase domain-containing protein n=1 Tax=Actinomortierella ambigua TaxID=1343610 RepID=A0A9P6TVD7_9FUNG|nr:hypothetical protein DFQ27_001086 [Actinomortierella ambigua]
MPTVTAIDPATPNSTLPNAAAVLSSPKQPLLSTTFSPDPQQEADFQRQYPDYEEAEETFPLWIEGVDTTYAPFIPTSTRRVLIALQMVRLCATDKVLDVGSGDGRFCFAAVHFFHAQKAVSIEYEQDLVDRSIALAPKEYLDQDKMAFLRADLTQWRDMPIMLSREWSVIIVFLSLEGGTQLTAGRNLPTSLSAIAWIASAGKSLSNACLAPSVGNRHRSPAT